MSEWWRASFQTTVDAYYQGDLAAGLAACERLNAARGLPEEIARLTRGNLVFYTPTLAALAPSFQAQRIAIPVPEGWSCYNPSIAANGDRFRLILRAGNYRVDPPLRYTVHDADGIVRTTNYLLELAPDLSIIDAQPIDDHAFRPEPPLFRVAGFEDGRLVRHAGDWWLSATVRDRAADGVSRIALLRLDGATAAQEFLLSDGQGRSEKNWMPVAGGKALRFVYSCDPTTLLRFDRKRGTVTTERRRPAPHLARHFRGGSQLIPLDDGHLGLIHEVVFTGDGGRRYLHRWVWFSRGWKLKRVSPPFLFQAPGIEFAAGLARRGEDLVISYGVWDREAWLATVALAEVRAILCKPLRAKEAERLIRASAAMEPPAEPPAAEVAAEPANAAAEPPPEEEWWRPGFQVTVDAYYRGDLEAGRATCERLLVVDGLPAGIEVQVRRNAVFYAPTLAEAAPSFRTREIDFAVPAQWTRFNPSIAADPDGTLRMIVRSANYAFDRQMRYTIHDADRIIRTSNYLVELDADLNVATVRAIADDAFRQDSPATGFTGFEDCRLFFHADGWWASATTWDHTATTKCQMALLRLQGATVAEMHLLSDGVSRQEKNWMPVVPGRGDPIRFVYSCSPAVILAFDARTWTVVPEVISPTSPALRRASGGTQAIPHDGGHLALVHEAVPFEDASRVYLHRWIWFDAEWRLARISPPFTFGGRRVEFAAGLARRGDELVISYGVDDREAWLGTVSLAEASAMLAAPLDPEAAEADLHAYARPSIVSTTLTGNNRKIIGDALRSVVDWVDWCLVIDTGITDDTLEIAREVAGDKLVVRHFPWCDDFAAARNFALEAARELGADWAVTLDSDERLDLGGIDVRQALLGTQGDALHVLHANGTYGKERFFRLPAVGRYAGPTHEAFVRERGRTATLAGIRFDELRKSARQYRRKAERDIAILTRQTAEHPHDPRWFYYLGDSLAGLDRHEEAVEAFLACAALDGWDEENGWARYRAAGCLIRLGRLEEAVAVCADGAVRHAGMAELPWLAAYASWKRGEMAEAVRWARLAAERGCFAGNGATRQRIGFRHPPALWEGPYDVLRFALRALGDDAGADEAEALHARAKGERVRSEQPA